MSIAARILVIFFPALVIGCATGPSGEVYDSPIGKWTEQWESSSGDTKTSRLTIFDKTSGEYRYPYNSRVEFFAVDDQRTWKGYWINDNNHGMKCDQERGGSKFWGEQIFHFNETYTRYKGTWDYCGQDRKFATSGAR